MHHELALGVYLQPLDPFEVEHDPLWVRPRCDDEVVLELALVAVVDKVDAGIDVAVLHLRVGRDVGPPLRRIVADEVIRLSGKLLKPADARLGRHTHEAYTEYDIRVRPCEHEHRLVGGEIEAVAGAAREEAYVVVRLATIRLEVQ